MRRTQRPGPASRSGSCDDATGVAAVPVQYRQRPRMSTEHNNLQVGGIRASLAGPLPRHSSPEPLNRARHRRCSDASRAARAGWHPKGCSPEPARRGRGHRRTSPGRHGDGDSHPATWHAVQFSRSRTLPSTPFHGDLRAWALRVRSAPPVQAGIGGRLELGQSATPQHCLIVHCEAESRNPTEQEQGGAGSPYAAWAL